jgi:hypothetical protein
MATRAHFTNLGAIEYVDRKGVIDIPRSWLVRLEVLAHHVAIDPDIPHCRSRPAAEAGRERCSVVVSGRVSECASGTWVLGVAVCCAAISCSTMVAQCGADQKSALF